MAEYIEKNDLIKHIERSFGEISTPFVVKEIKDFSTANVVEVNHGELIKVADLCGIEVLKCSVCGMERPRNSTAFYCDCGAKMDGEKNEAN